MISLSSLFGGRVVHLTGNSTKFFLHIKNRIWGGRPKTGQKPESKNASDSSFRGESDGIDEKIPRPTPDPKKLKKIWIHPDSSEEIIN